MNRPGLAERFLIRQSQAMNPESEFDPKTENRAAFLLAVYVLWFVLVSAGLLAINTWMIYSLAQGTARLLPEMYAITILVQLMIFIGPMVLLYLEWFVWDVIFSQRIGRVKNRRKSTEGT